MDKKKQINFNLNNFLLASSFALDYIQKEQFKTSSNHHKRVAFIALNLALKFNFEPKQMSDICSYSLAYEFSNEDLEKFPFLQTENIFENILIKEIVLFSSEIDKNFSLCKKHVENKRNILEFVEKNKNNFSTELIEYFYEISKTNSFWLDLANENDILMFIFGNLHDFSFPLDFENLLELTQVFSKLENPNSKLVEFSEKMSDFYNFDHKDKYTFSISASICKIGLLVIDKKLLNKKETLSEDEKNLISAYPYYTKKVLANIMGFNDITSWAIKVQERIDGSGYVFGFDGKNLSLKDRILSTLNIYDALLQNKPYRKAYTHNEAIKIMKEEAIQGKIDIAIVEDINKVFK